MMLKKNKWVRMNGDEAITLKELSRWVDSYDILRHYLSEYEGTQGITDNSELFIPQLGNIRIIMQHNGRRIIYRVVQISTGETLNVIQLLQRMFDMDKQAVVNKIAKEITGIYKERRGIVFKLVEEKPEKVRFSFFNKPITNIVPSQDISLEEFAKHLQSGKYKNIIYEIRNAPNKSIRNELKRFKLDFVTVSGKFTKRNANNLSKHSGLLCLDFDDVDNPSELKAKLELDYKLNPKLIFISPSGNGIKCIVEIDVRKYSHEEYFLALERYFAKEYVIQLDSSGKDVSRACFVSFDPQLYFREN
jgi:hypothetical protein